MIKVGDSIIVNENLVLVKEGEEKFIGQKAKISIVDDFVFPVGLVFENEEIQRLYEDLGSRRFDFAELTKILWNNHFKGK